MNPLSDYRQVSTQLLIAATADQIWDVLVDFERLPHWNHFIRSISGSPSVGSHLQVKLQPEGASAMSFTPLVVHAEPKKHFAWRGKVLVKGLFDGTHSFRLEPQADGQTLFIHEEQFAGVLVPLFKGMLSRLPKTFDRFNKELQAEVYKRYL